VAGATLGIWHMPKVAPAASGRDSTFGVTRHYLRFRNANCWNDWWGGLACSATHKVSQLLLLSQRAASCVTLRMFPITRVAAAQTCRQGCCLACWPCGQQVEHVPKLGRSPAVSSRPMAWLLGLHYAIANATASKRPFSKSSSQDLC
jgi:hypothetical protein